MSSYGEFLQGKQTFRWEHGPDISYSDIHPTLYEWQKRIVQWAAKTGRAAIFADCGLGKTFMQLEWARLVSDSALIVAPLSVARQTVREAHKIDIDVGYVRNQDEISGPGIWITNYEMVEHFDPSEFGAVVLDESSILKNVDGKTRRLLTSAFKQVPLRLACTATPAPNDVAELTNHAEYLGVMSRAEMLAAYFINDEREWRVKGHAVEPLYKWMGTWAVALRKPSDLGYDNEGFNLPPLRVRPEVVKVEIQPENQLFATDLGGIGGRSRVRRDTLDARVERAVEVINGHKTQWIAWTGLNDEASLLHKCIPDSVNVQGSWSPADKASALEAFQDGEIRVLITKPSIAGFGMNFQNAHKQIFVGIGDSYESYYQAIRRSWRFGQQFPVDAHIVVSELETQIVDNVKRKEQEAAQVIDGLVRHMDSELRVA